MAGITLITIAFFVWLGAKYQKDQTDKCLATCTEAEKIINESSHDDEDHLYQAYELIQKAHDLTYDRHTMDRYSEVSYAFKKKFSNLILELNHESIAK